MPPLHRKLTVFSPEALGIDRRGSTITESSSMLAKGLTNDIGITDDDFDVAPETETKHLAVLLRLRLVDLLETAR